MRRLQVGADLLNRLNFGEYYGLFAGSYEAAQRAAILYSLLNTCTLHGVNQREWLVDVLTRIHRIAKEEMHTLLPQHWKATQQTTLAKAA